MKLLLNLFFDFILPRFCYNCGIGLSPAEDLFCSKCFSEITRVSPERLKREFERKFEAEKIISGFQSLFVFENDGGVQKLIHEIKYNNYFIAGKKLGRLTAAELAPFVTVWKADIIIPVPIHRLRRAERGYNQSYYISKGISQILKIPVMPRLIMRARYTSTQTALDLADRKLNVKDAFLLKNREAITGKRIILVDDVITTGATLSECGKVLLAGGADKIFAVSAALAD